MRLPILLLFLYLNITAFTQTPTIVWEVQGTPTQLLQSSILLPDGRIAVVGSEQNAGGQQIGVLLLIDATTGTVLTKKNYTAFNKDSGFNAIAEAADGSFYIVGYSRSSKKSQKGWLLRVDEQGNKLWETEWGKEGLNELEKIVWLSTGTMVALGYKNGKNSSNRWLLSIEKGQIIKEQQLSTNTIRTVTELVPTADDKIWLLGNTRKSKRSQVGDIWIAQFDKDLTRKLFKIIEQKGIQSANSMSINHLGQITIGGFTTSNTLGDKDAWLLVINQQGQIIQEKVEQGIQENEITTVLTTPAGLTWLCLQTIPDNSQLDQFHQQVGYLSTKEAIRFNDLKSLKGDQFRNFSPVQALQTYQETMVLIGNNTAIGSFQLISLEGPGKVTPKGALQVSYDNLQLSFEDKNQDHCLSSEERGSIQFELQNNGTTDITNGSIELLSQQVVEGLYFPRTKQYLGYLSAGNKKTITIPVIARKKLQSGNSTLTIKVQAQNQPLLSIPFQIESVYCNQQQDTPIKVFWLQPDIVTSRTIRTVEQQCPIEVNILAPRLLKMSDVKIYSSGILLEDEKNQTKNIQSTNTKEGILHRFSYTINHLSEGVNDIYISIGAYQSDILNINYAPRKPNLHVLAIGPTYKDLQYPAKDASDFAQAIKSQFNTAFFNELIIDTLTTPATTSTTKIRTAFEKLSHRFINKQHRNFIATNDYLLVFISGHGERHDGQFRFIPSDYDSDAAITTTVDYEKHIIAFLNQIKCKKILFIDACLSGATLGRKAKRDDRIADALLRANSSATGTAIFTSCSERESSFEYPLVKNGVFTEVLIEAITNQSVALNNGQTLIADGGLQAVTNGDVSIKELDFFLKTRVPDLLQQAQIIYPQTPNSAIKDLPANFPVFILMKK